MFRPARASWRLSIDEAEDLHFALFIRDACGLAVSASPGRLREAPSLADLVPACEKVAVGAAWHAWWQALLSAHQATSGRSPEGLTPQQHLEWRYQPRMEVFGVPPDFVGLAHAPALQEAAAHCWQEDFRRWWEHPLTAELRNARPEIPVGGVRGELLAAIMAGARSRLVQDVVVEVERAIGRKAAPFELGLEVLAVEGEMPMQLTPDHALVPIGLFTDSIRYRQWLRQTIVLIA